MASWTDAPPGGPDLSSWATADLRVLNALPIQVAVLDPAGRILMVNEAWRRFVAANGLGAAASPVGQDYLAVCDVGADCGAPQSAEAAAGLRALLAGTQSAFTLDYPCHAPAEKRWFRLVATPLVLPEGRGAVVMHLNITETYQAQQAARLSTEQLGLLSQSDLIGVFRWHQDGAVSTANDTFLKMLGYTTADLAAGRVNWRQMTPPEYQAADDAGLKTVGREGRCAALEKEYIRADGTRIRVLVGGAALASDATQGVGYALDISALRQAEHDRAAAEERFQIVARLTTQATFTCDLTTQVTVRTDGVNRSFGYAHENTAVPLDWWRERIHPADSSRVLGSLSAAVDGQATEWSTEYRFRRADGTYATVIDRTAILRDPNGRATHIIGGMQDVTAERDALARLAHSEQLFRAFLDENSLALAWLKNERGELVLRNRKNTEMFPRLTPGDGPLTDFDVHADPAVAREVWANDLRVLASGRPVETIEQAQGRDGVLRSWQVIKFPLTGPDGQRYVGGFAIDVTGHKAMEAQLRQLALHDTLTGLPNRALFLDRLGHMFQRAERDDATGFAILFIDLDGFKDINDSMGHGAGDVLLKQVAARLQATVRPADTVARLGGDEFTVLLERVGSTAEAVQVAERIIRAMHDPLVLHGQEVFLTASIGLTAWSANYATPDEMLRDADTAMYRAKALGKARVEVFDHTMHGAVVERLRLHTQLRRALERQELVVHYQPIVALPGGRAAGVEAMVRWQHPDLGLVPPERFIPLAEETGLIIELGQWVIEQACRCGSEILRSAGTRAAFYVSVNLSARQLHQADVVGVIKSALVGSGLPPGALVLELTESAIMADAELARTVLTRLTTMGVRIAIDDFGTGYSSLSYLTRLPISMLKIDQSFVGGLPMDTENAEVVRAIAGLARQLRLQVIAEGVERADQLAHIADLNCDAAQGYLFAYPMAVPALREWLAGRHGAGPLENLARQRPGT